MPVAKVLSRKLKESLGPDTGEALVAWMDQADTLHDDMSALGGSIDALRRDMKQESQGFRREMQDSRREMQDFCRDMQREMKEMRVALEARMDIGFANTEAKFERRISDLMKWSFVFWCGAVAAIAALAGVLR